MSGERCRRPFAWLALPLLTLAGVMAGACTFADGRPWAEVHGSLTVVAVDDVGAPDVTLTDATFRAPGRGPQATTIEVLSLSVVLGPIQLVQSTEGPESPEEPAPCADEHCHEATDLDGNERGAERAGPRSNAPTDGPAGTRRDKHGDEDRDERSGDDHHDDATVFTVLASPQSVTLDDAPIVLAFDACAPLGCAVDDTTITGLRVEWSHLEIQLRIAPDGPGIEPRVLTIDVDSSHWLTAPLAEAIEYRGENQVHIDARLALSARFVDAIDWSTLDGDLPDPQRHDIEDALTEAFSDSLDLTIGVHRTRD